MWFFSSRTNRSVRRVPAARKLRLEVLEDRCVPSAGALDPTFGNGAGYVITPVTNFFNSAVTALIQPDGKIIATGNARPTVYITPEDMAVARYNTDGSLDSSFGSGGTALVSFGPHTILNWRSSLYPQAGTANDGKIVLQGYYNGQLAVARLTANGTPDATFGTGGTVTTSFSAGGFGLESGGVVVTGAGQIVAGGGVGSVYMGGYYNAALVLARYNNDGTLDNTFGLGGEVTTTFAQFPAVSPIALLQQADGKLLEVGDGNGSAGHDWLLVRYNANGSLDTSFGNQGIATAPFGNGGQAENAVLYPNAGTANDGKIVLVGDQATWEAVRFNTNGSLDTSFGSGGEAVTPWSGRSWGVAVDANGRVVITGNNGTGTPELARLNVDGTPDTTFGTGGLVTQPGASSVGVAIYPNAGTPNDGKIVSVGNGKDVNNKTDFVVARFLGDSAGFTVTGFPSNVTAGTAGTFTATIKDASGNVLTGYTGTVHFTSSDPQAVLPADYTFTAADQGSHTFGATLKTAGFQSITVTDTQTPTYTGGESGIQVNPAAATHFSIGGPSSVRSGSSFSLVVTALDAYGNVATGYRGTVKFTDSVSGAALPGNYTFTAADAGVHTFTGLKLRTKGKHTITVMDTLTGSIMGTLIITVT